MKNAMVLMGILILMRVVICTGIADDVPVQVTIDVEHPKWTISKYLTGMHFVYAFERDALYADERVADWMRRCRVGVIRWPGGTVVQHYHWNDLNGIAFKQDTWDPRYDETPRKPEMYMDLDEYLAFCNRVGAEPMVGINIKSGKKYNREADAVNAARRLIEYGKAQGADVPFWYIGNECFKGFGAVSYIKYIQQYAQVLRSVDSNINIIADWKFGPEHKHRFKQTLQIACNAEGLNIMEIHEKWGNPWGLKSGRSVSDWKQEFPLYNGALSRYIKTFHEKMDAAGRPNIRLAFNEWGVGGIDNGDPFDYALVAADFLMELFRNRIYQACYWNLNMGPKESRVLVTTDYRGRLEKFNPVAHVFEMYAHALEQQLVPVHTSKKYVYGFATLNQVPHMPVVQVYLMNKHPRPSIAELKPLSGDRTMKALGESLVAPGHVTPLGAIQETDMAPWRFRLEPYSFSRITLKSP
jgi:hypothetical protein